LLYELIFGYIFRKFEIFLWIFFGYIFLDATDVLPNNLVSRPEVRGLLKKKVKSVEITPCVTLW